MMETETTLSSSSSSEYLLYPQRWLVLASFSLLSMSSAWIWITFSPMATSMADWWDVSIDQVDAIAAIYLYTFVPFSFLSLYLVVNHLGLTIGLLVGGLFNVAGAAVRWHFMDSYNMVYFGTFLAAYAQTYTLSTPPLIANRWFGSQERATATALGVLANQMGTAIGLGITAVVDMEIVEGQDDNNTTDTINEARLRNYLWVQMTVASIALILVAVFVKDVPPTPPSKSAADILRENKPPNDDMSEATALLSKNVLVPRLSYWESIRNVFASVPNTTFVLTFGMTVGVFYTIPTLLSQLVVVSSTDDGDVSDAAMVGWLGIVYQAGGTVGSLGAGRLVDITQHHRPVYLSLLLLAAVSLGLFSLAVTFGAAGFLKSIGTMVAVALSGFGLAASNTIGLDYGTAMMYPADEAAVAGVMECAAELFGFVWVLMGGTVLARNDDGRSVLLGVLAVAVLVSFWISLVSRYKVQRPS